MRPTLRLALAAAALVAATSAPAAAQQQQQQKKQQSSKAGAAGAAATAPTGLPADLLTDLAELEKKMIGLARAIPADKYGWRPGEGVRSVGEVLMHVAADNYLLPASIGHAPDSVAAIKSGDFKAAQAYERRTLDREATIAEVQRSFAYVRRSLTATPPKRLGEQVTMFGQKFTLQQSWILTTTHLHEHLGQLIAYARSNGVTPPWSQGG